MMHYWGSYSWWGSGPMFGLGVAGLFFLAIFAAIEIALKGFALWYAAKRDEKWWFVIMLIINTAGILEIVYLVFFVHKWHHRLKKGSMSHHDHGSHTN